MSRREQIQMSDEEALVFLEEERIVTCATHGPRGFPHLMPLWYVVRDGTVWAWTFAKSQKVLNLERDARTTLQVEAGDSYDQLRGVMLECETVVHDDLALVRGVGEDVLRRYSGSDELAPEAAEIVAQQAAKRVAMEFRERHRATWDHRKLGGAY